jgi:hypothetical protein
MLFNVGSLSKLSNLNRFARCLARRSEKPDTFTGLAGASILRVAHEGREWMLLKNTKTATRR